MDNNIPETGRIGRFARIVQANSDHDTSTYILQDSWDYGKLKPLQKAEWWRNAVERMENSLGEAVSIDVMQECGRRCCGQGNRKTAKRIMAESNSLEMFLEKASTYGVKEGEIEYKLVKEDLIIGRFTRCFCGQVKQGMNQFETRTYCHCSAEFHKQFFEAALGRQVNVEIKQSIICGDPHCEFEIHLIACD